MARKNEVTHIKVNVKRPDRRSIYLDGEFAFSIAEGIFYDHGIEIGDRLTDGEINMLVSQDEQGKVKGAALNLLSYRQRSTRELQRKLLKKGWSMEMIEPVLRELEEKGFLNDREFAEMLARDRTGRKQLGPRALKDELMKAGVDRDMIEEILEDTYRQHPPSVLIERLLKNKGIEPGERLERKERARLINLLRRKGYTWEDMEPVISRLKSD